MRLRPGGRGRRVLLGGERPSLRPFFSGGAGASGAGQAKNLLGGCAKWDGKRVWDCGGLFRGAWRALDKYKSGGATRIYKAWCAETGRIGGMPNVPGLAVFQAGPPEISHIGLYVGGGIALDARGSTKRCCTRGLTATHGRTGSAWAA